MNNKIRYLLLLGAFFFASCQFNTDEQIEGPTITEQIEFEGKDAPFVEGCLVLGRVRENPYSVENMRKAYSALSSKKGTKCDTEEIQTTHLYVKFKPKNENEMCNLLLSDSTILFYPFPLDRAIVQRGTYYHDPEVPDSLPTYQYASLRVDQKIPTVTDYEILAELYIPDDVNNPTKALPDMSPKELVDEAMRITGNEDFLDETPDNSSTRSWRPTGTIRVYDNILGRYVGVPGARVRVVKWFNTYYGYTNTNGVYNINETVSGQYHYCILWERYEKYDIRDGTLNQALSDGPTQSGSWNLDINSGKTRHWAAITRALYRYYFDTVDGLYRMPSSMTGLKIAFKDEAGRAGYYRNGDGGTAIERFDIEMYRYELGTTREITVSDQIGTLFHELTHAIHYYNRGENAYPATEQIIRESWATFGKWKLLDLEYTARGATAAQKANVINNNVTMQDWPNRWDVNGEYQYSPLFIDLQDTNNQYNSYFTRRPVDEVSGYQTANLALFVYNVTTLSALQQYLSTNLPEGMTAAKVDALFTAYNEWRNGNNPSL